MNNSLKRENYCLSIIVLLFVFVRTLITVPEQVLGVSIDAFEYNGSVANIIFCVLLVTYSVLMYLVLCRLYEKINEYFYIIAALIFFDCVSFSTIDNCLKLIAIVLGLLCVLNALRPKPLIKTEITVVAFSFICAFLMPTSLLSLVPLALMIYIFCNMSGNKLSVKLTVPVSLVLSAAGVCLNKVLCSNVEAFGEFFKTFGFSRILHTNKSWKLILVVLPIAVVSFIFYSKFLKIQSKKKRGGKSSKSVLSVDIVSVLCLLSVIGLIFFESEAFFTVNLIFPTAICVAAIKNDEITKETLDYFNSKIAKNKLLALIVFVVAFYVCFSVMGLYNSGWKIVEYIRYGS